MTDYFYIDRIMKATAFATRAHGQQKRKYSGEPYINHPISVAGILVSYLSTISMDVSKRTNIICAALMHDVLEDTPVSEKEMAEAFGDKITKIVKMVTNVSTPSDGNRATRKLMEIDHVMKASWAGKMVKIADLVDNTNDICRQDAEFSKTYLPEKYRMLTQGIAFDPGTEGYDLYHYALELCKHHAKVFNINLNPEPIILQPQGLTIRANDCNLIPVNSNFERN